MQVPPRGSRVYQGQNTTKSPDGDTATARNGTAEPLGLGYKSEERFLSHERAPV